MPIAQYLMERARMFEENVPNRRATQFSDSITEKWPRNRALSVEHQEIKPEHESAH